MSFNPYKRNVGRRLSRIEPYITLACGFLTVLLPIAMGIALGSDEQQILDEGVGEGVEAEAAEAIEGCGQALRRGSELKGLVWASLLLAATSVHSFCWRTLT